MIRRRGGLRFLVAPLLGALLAAPMPADVLVLRDGTRVETRGAWTVRGALIVFTDGSGQLRSLRARDVELDRSRAATVAAEGVVAKGSVPQPSTPGEPILRLTEADLPPVDDPDAMTPAERQQRPVVLYATSWCGWCRKTRALFAELGVDFIERDVERDLQAASERDRLNGGRSSVPVVDWRGETVSGFAEARFRDLAARDREAAAKAAAHEAAPDEAGGGEP